ncbi:MAG: SEC-C metal-binding domain-containing protein [Desulfomonilaceae bacterium]|nr:SEC-C metal-binding domain-containing protein [Desulfomonilaceae bacterium]
MKKIKSPWYGVVWIVIWTAALVWFLSSGMFNQRESIGLILVWAIMVGITVFLLIQHLRVQMKQTREPVKPANVKPSLNGPCPCGSGKKYKRCCAGKEG